jgi:hypothetical protein
VRFRRVAYVTILKLFNRMRWRRLCIALPILVASPVKNFILVKTEELLLKRGDARLAEA